MARLNTLPSRPPVVTHEGAPARHIDAEAQLRRSVMACLLWEQTFYEDGQTIADRIASLVAEVPLETAAAIAIEAREKMHLRHAPLLIVREMARRNGKIVGDALAQVIQRADELAEFLALYWKDGKQPLSKQVKRGLAEAFGKFDAHQLAKYDRAGAVRLRDVLFLTHAKPANEHQEGVWKGLVDGTLPAPDTWEVALSSGADKRETWIRLVEGGNLGGLALLRNLRNMQSAGVPESFIRQAITINRFHRVLPFRFIAAAKYAPALEDVLEAAMFRALEGVEKLPGRTALLLDNSGSMHAPLSGKSDLSRVDAAGGLGMLLREICEQVTVIGFGTSAAVLPPRRGFALAEAYQRGPGGGTNTETAKRMADQGGYDRIIILTDEQSHQAISAPQGAGYVVNVAAYQNGVGYGKWRHIDGWSENVVRYIVEAEKSE